MEDSDGQIISVLEGLTGEKTPKRGFFEKYFGCCFGKRKEVRFK